MSSTDDLAVDQSACGMKYNARGWRDMKINIVPVYGINGIPVSVLFLCKIWSPYLLIICFYLNAKYLIFKVFVCRV